MSITNNEIVQNSKSKPKSSLSCVPLSRLALLILESEAFLLAPVFWIQIQILYYFYRCVNFCQQKNKNKFCTKFWESLLTAIFIVSLEKTSIYSKLGLQNNLYSLNEFFEWKDACTASNKQKNGPVEPGFRIHVKTIRIRKTVYQKKNDDCLLLNLEMS